jgi:hypothetical protein
MDLNELKFLGAASLLAGSVRPCLSSGRESTAIPDSAEIQAAVRSAQEIWEEVLKQDRES